MNRVTLYTKPDCHLCEAVEQVIAKVQRELTFELTIRNILEHPNDFANYQQAIPVVLLNEVEIARYRLSESELLDRLREK